MERSFLQEMMRSGVAAGSWLKPVPHPDNSPVPKNPLNDHLFKIGSFSQVLGRFFVVALLAAANC